MQFYIFFQLTAFGWALVGLSWIFVKVFSRRFDGVTRRHNVIDGTTFAETAPSGKTSFERP